MRSLFDELSGKIGPDTARNLRDGARRDLGILLFSKRDELAGLWKAADRFLGLPGTEAPPDLRAAVDMLRPLFGERA